MSFVSDAWKDITGRTERDAIRDATAQGIQYGEDANQVLTDAMNAGANLFDPFRQLGQDAMGYSSQLFDPQSQFQYLQNNPLFQMGLDNANQQTNKMAAAQGRLSSGDTLMQLSNNTLLAGMPLLQNQHQNIWRGIDTGFNATGNQANLNNALSGQIANNLMSMGGFQAEGTLAGGQAQANVTNSTINTLGNIVGMFSDIRLKDDVNKIGEKNGYNLYEWKWNDKANELGLYGKDTGVMYHEVAITNPEATKLVQGYGTVNYEMLGV